VRFEPIIFDYSQFELIKFPELDNNIPINGLVRAFNSSEIKRYSLEFYEQEVLTRQSDIRQSLHYQNEIIKCLKND